MCEVKAFRRSYRPDESRLRTLSQRSQQFCYQKSPLVRVTENGQQGEASSSVRATEDQFPGKYCSLQKTLKLLAYIHKNITEESLLAF
jgi:hypothetical protein